MKKNRKLLIITEDSPSGLNGNSVKTRNTLHYLLDNKYSVDIVCSNSVNYKFHELNHKNLRIFISKSPQVQKNLITFIIRLTKIIFSLVPFSIKRLYSSEQKKIIVDLLRDNTYKAILFDGFSTLQYLDSVLKRERYLAGNKVDHSKESLQKIYIDDEDFTDLFRQRFIQETNVLQNMFYFHEYVKSLFFEKNTLPRLSQIWAISSQNKTRFEKISGVKTVLMPNYFPLQNNLYSNLGNQLVFTGTLNWKENSDGLTWFLNTHWKKIVREVPSASLKVIGQGASKRLVSFLNSTQKVKYLGYVKNLEKEYEKSVLAISPIRINAGIKVKILTYLSYALPVVSTQIASVGLISNNGVEITTDDTFADKIISLLKDRKKRKSLSNKAYQNIRDNYSKELLHDFFQRNL